VLPCLRLGAHAHMRVIERAWAPRLMNRRQRAAARWQLPSAQIWPGAAARWQLPSAQKWLASAQRWPGAAARWQLPSTQKWSGSGPHVGQVGRLVGWVARPRWESSLWEVLLYLPRSCEWVVSDNWPTRVETLTGSRGIASSWAAVTSSHSEQHSHGPVTSSHSRNRHRNSGYITDCRICRGV
jgi:hypothetical protein